MAWCLNRQQAIIWTNGGLIHWRIYVTLPQWVQQEYMPHCVFPAWASYQIRKIAGCACAGNAGKVFPRRRFQRKPLVSDPGMHHGTCVTHVPWCMSGSLTCGNGENVPGIPGACAPGILRIWQEAHGVCSGFWAISSGLTHYVFDSLVPCDATLHHVIVYW